MIPNLKKELECLIPHVAQSQWADHEHVRGYGIFGLPLSTGHNLALRVFPENDFAPYITIWHQTPAGKWTIYYDAIRPDIACPRYYGKAVDHILPAKINLEWQSSSVLTIRMKKPKLEWTVWMEEPRYLRLINSISKRMPFWTWKYDLLLKFREWMAEWLRIGKIKLAGYMPSGHFGILMPQRMYFINRTQIQLEGDDLGQPVIVHPNPKIGDVPLPARGIFSIGEAYWNIMDFDEYQKTRAALNNILEGVELHKEWFANHLKLKLQNPLHEVV